MTDRARWSEHRNFGGPASLILEIHDSFRAASGWLLEESRRPEPDLAAIRRTFTELASVLHHHHHAEEVMLFPRLARTGSPPEGLVADHQALLAAIDAMQRALAGQEGVPEALAELDRLLVDHLDVEESVAVPYLLEHPDW